MIPIKDYAGPRRRIPWMTWGLIAVNVGIFLYQVSLGPDAQAFMFAYSVVPVALTHGIPQTSLPGVPAHFPFHTPNPVYLTLITAMFLHAGWLHIGGNMLFLYIFIFFFVLTLLSIVLIGLWFLLQFFDGVAALSNVQQGMGGVAYFAHVGGFVTGLVITLLLRPWLRPPTSVSYPYIPRHPDAADRSE